MKAYIGIKYYQDYRNKLIIERISSTLENKGFETICLARDIDTKNQIISSPQMLMKLISAEMENCDLVVIDLSEKGVGLGIEAGYAFAKGIPILTIAKRGSEISETLEGISEEIIFYDSIGDLENIDFFEVQNGGL